MFVPPTVCDALVDEAARAAGAGDLDAARELAGRAWRNATGAGARWRAAALLRDCADVQGDRGGAARWAVAAWEQLSGTAAARDALGGATLVEAAGATAAAGQLAANARLASQARRDGVRCDDLLGARLAWSAATAAAACGAPPDEIRRAARVWCEDAGPEVADHLGDAAAFWERRGVPVSTVVAARLDELGAPLEVRAAAWVEALSDAEDPAEHHVVAAFAAAADDLALQVQLLCALGRHREAAERLADAASVGEEAAWQAAPLAATFDADAGAVLLGVAAGAEAPGAVVAAAAATAWLLAGRCEHERATEVLSAAEARVGRSARHLLALATARHGVAVHAGDLRAAALAADDMVLHAAARADRHPDGWAPLRSAVTSCARAWLRAGHPGTASRRIPALEQPWQLSAWAQVSLEVAVGDADGAQRDRYVALLCAAGDVRGAAELADTPEQRDLVMSAATR